MKARWRTALQKPLDSKLSAISLYVGEQSVDDDNRSTAITELLNAWQAGDRDAGNRLLSQVYEELRVIARRQMRGENAGHTLQPTALVNEAILRLADGNLAFRERSHFLATCARTMRRVLIDHARAVRSQKRGGDRVQVTLAEGVAGGDAALDILALEDALERLEQRDAQKAKVFELAFFGGLTGAQIAEALDLSPSKAHREMTFAKAWISDELGS